MLEKKTMRPEDEISLEDFLKAIKRYAKLLAKSWKILAISIAVSLIALWFWNSNRPPTYEAELTLMLSDDGGQSITGIPSILGQIGLPVSSGKYNIDKLLEIARSRHILEQVLQHTYWIDGKEYNIAEELIRLYDIDKSWSENLGTAYVGHFSQDLDQNQYNYGVKRLHSLINGQETQGGLLQMEYGRDHYIMTFSLESLSEDLSIQYLNAHFDHLKNFYVDKAVEKQKSSYDIIKAKKDSIYSSYEAIESEIARLRDLNQNSFRSTSSAQLSKLSTESLVLKTAYAKAEENLAIAELALQNNTPLIQLLDPPIKPIEPNELSTLRLLLYGVTFGLILTLVIIITLYLIRL